MTNSEIIALLMPVVGALTVTGTGVSGEMANHRSKAEAQAEAKAQG